MQVLFFLTHQALSAAMFTNVFPQSLATHIAEQWPHQQLQCTMLRLISCEEYHKWEKSNTGNRHFLHPKEQKQLAGYHLKKRRDEWLTARICAKIAVNNFLSDMNFPPNQLIITNTASGRPALTGQLPKKLHHADVSLSHGAGYGLAAVGTRYCGVDIERTTRNFHAVQEKFCCSAEKHYIKQQAAKLSEQQCLALLWSAKEASKKAFSFKKMPGFLELHLTKLTKHNHTWILDLSIQENPKKQPVVISVIAALLPGISIAVATIPKNYNA